MRKHTLSLLGGRPGELRVPAETLIEAVGALLEGARQAARFFVEGESTRKGPRPSWLDAVSRLEVTDLRPGSTVVAIEAPTLAEAVPDRFGAGRQVALFAEPARTLDVQQTAVDFFGSVLASASLGDRDQLLADRALLDTCARFARSVGGGFEAIQLAGIAGREEPLIIKPADVPQIELLRDETPPSKVIRLTGTLDTISASRTDIVLVLATGETVSARLERHDGATLKELFSTKVVVSGIGHFRPSGRLLVIDVEHLSKAGDKDTLWEAVPAAPITRETPVAHLLPQDETSGVSALFDTWPGDETDEDLQSALKALA